MLNHAGVTGRPRAQSQGGDEFWYTCVPDQYAAQTQECGGGNFRETEVSINDQPAAVAPVLPWIYAGGIDPYLWRPPPATQTLNFMPYRIDLTPFASQLSDGRAHEVAVSVAGAHEYFSATATLLVYRDKHARAADTLQFDSSFAITGHTDQRSAQEYRYGDPLGSCYQGSLTTAAGVLTAYQQGQGCRDGRNTAVWFSHPDGSADSRSWSPFW